MKLHASDLYDPDETFSISAHQLALLFMRTKADRGIVRSRVYADGEVIGRNALPVGKVLLVTVEFVPEKQMLDELDDMED